MVYGTAPKVITTKDESLMKCPFDTKFEEDPREEDPFFDPDADNMKIRVVQKKPPEEVKDFGVAKPEEIYSRYDKEHEEKGEH